MRRVGRRSVRSSTSVDPTDVSSPPGLPHPTTRCSTGEPRRWIVKLENRRKRCRALSSSTILSGCPPNAVAQTYPDASVQAVVEPAPSWWLKDCPLGHGSLVWAIVPYPEQKPHRLVAVGRGADDYQHYSATYRLEEFRVGAPQPETSTLPVAAMPLHDGESYMVQRGKMRPCLILVEPEEELDRSLTRGARRWQTARTRLVAPFYSANGSSSRGGWLPELVSQIRRCDHPQYFWDLLPLSNSSPEGSILRFDHTFSIGRDPATIVPTGYALHADALDVLKDWYLWYVMGTVAEGRALDMARELLREHSAAPDPV